MEFSEGGTVYYCHVSSHVKFGTAGVVKNKSDNGNYNVEFNNECINVKPEHLSQSEPQIDGGLSINAPVYVVASCLKIGGVAVPYGAEGTLLGLVEGKPAVIFPDMPDGIPAVLEYKMLSSTKKEQKFPGDFKQNGPVFVNRFGLNSDGKALDYGTEGKVVSPGEDDDHIKVEFPGFDTVLTLKVEFLSTTAPNSTMPAGFAVGDLVYCIVELKFVDVTLPVGSEGVVAGAAAADDRIAVTFAPQVTNKFDIPITALSKDKPTDLVVSKDKPVDLVVVCALLTFVVLSMCLHG